MPVTPFDDAGTLFDADIPFDGETVGVVGGVITMHIQFARVQYQGPRFAYVELTECWFNRQ